MELPLKVTLIWQQLGHHLFKKKKKNRNDKLYVLDESDGLECTLFCLFSLVPETYRSEEHVGCVRRNGCWRRSCIHGVDCRNLVEEESGEVEDD